MSMTGEHDTTDAGNESTTAPSVDAAGRGEVADATIATEVVVDPTSVTAPDHDEITRTLDRLSLTQALVDFELSNARVLDLTARLVEANERVVRGQAEADGLRGEIVALRVEADAARGALAEVQASRSYRLAKRIAAVAAALRKG